MKIHTIGWYGHNNVGDESYKLSFPLLFPKHTFTFSEFIEPADAYLLGGGDVVYGSYLKRLKEISNKRIMSTTLSNVVDIKDFKSIAVRDKKSLEYAKECGVEAELVPDFAFALTPDPQRGRKLIEQVFAEERAELYEKVVAVTINGYLLPHDDSTHRDAANFQTLSYELSRAMDTTCCSFISVPFGTAMPTDDRIASSWVMSKCKFWKKNVAIMERLSVQDTLDVMSACNGAISTRLHSSIFSCLSGVPFIDIIHNHKNEWFLDTIEYHRHSLSYCGFSSQQICGSLNKILEGDEQTRKELMTTAGNYKCALLDFSNRIGTTLEG